MRYQYAKPPPWLGNGKVSAKKISLMTNFLNFAFIAQLKHSLNNTYTGLFGLFDVAYYGHTYEIKSNPPFVVFTSGKNLPNHYASSVAF